MKKSPLPIAETTLSRLCRLRCSHLLPVFLLSTLCIPVLSGNEPEFKEHHFDEIGATAQIPASWNIQQDTEEGVVVYQVTREKLSSNQQGEHTVGFTLSSTPDIPSRAGMSPTAYAADLLSFAVEDGGTVVKEERPPFKIFRATYLIDGDAGASEIVDLATANDTTGTLYFVAWQCPQSESDKIMGLREKILASFRFDPSR